MAKILFYITLIHKEFSGILPSKIMKNPTMLTHQDVWCIAVAQPFHS